MSDLIGSYTKAIDDLSGKIFIAGTIATLWVELGPWIVSTFEAHPSAVYLSCVLAGFLGSSAVLILIGEIQMHLDNINLPPVIGVGIMPIGFSFLFPQYFSDVNFGSHEVAGVAILAWSFMLIKLDWG